jgi:hypothetical protein
LIAVDFSLCNLWNLLFHIKYRIMCHCYYRCVITHDRGGDGRAQPGPHSGALTKHAMLIRAGKRHRLYTQQRLTHLEQLKHEIIKRK